MPLNDTPIYAGPPSNPKIAKALNLKIEPKPGSQEVHCSQCSQLMWIGPNIIKCHKTHPYPFWCYICLVKEGGTVDNVLPLGAGGHDYKEIDSGDATK